MSGQRYEKERGGWTWSPEAKARHRDRQAKRAEKRRAKNNRRDPGAGVDTLDNRDIVGGVTDSPDSGPTSGGDSGGEKRRGGYLGGSSHHVEGDDKEKRERLRKALPWIARKFNRFLNVIVIGISWLFNTKYVVYLEPITKEEADGDSDFYEDVAVEITPDLIKSHPWLMFWLMLGMDTVGKAKVALRKTKEEEKK